jgi:hypothetical protein
VPYFQRKPYAEMAQSGTPADSAAGDILDMASRVLAGETAVPAATDGPFRLRRSLVPGQSADMVLTLSQEGGTLPLATRLACSDLVGPSGRIAASQVRLDPAVVVLGPGATSDLRVTVTAAPGTQPGLYVGTISSTDNAGLSIRVEVPVAV